MSKTLIDESPHIFNPSLATKIGLNEAIILQQINYWIKINEKANRNYVDGRYWTFNSYTKWQEQFPYFSLKTIQRTLEKLRNIGLLIIGNYNKARYDRTLWYTINDVKLDEIEREIEENPRKIDNAI